MPPKRLATVQIFAPELWGQVALFSKFCDATYKFNEREQRALAGVAQHFEKAGRFQSLAVKIQPSLTLDRAEINEYGFTPAENSKELAVAIEAAIQEIYSSVDCTAKVLYAIYGKTSRGFKDSTRGVFKNFDKIEGAFPAEIKEILRAVVWYEELRFLRDELTHLGTGICTLAEDKNVVSYITSESKLTASRWWLRTHSHGFPRWSLPSTIS
jgi:hypothetical protein